MMHSHQQQHHHHHQQQQQQQFQFQQHQADQQQQQQYLQHQQRLQHEQQQQRLQHEQQQQQHQQQQQQQQQQSSQEEQLLYHANPQYRYLSPSTTAGGVPVRKVPCKARNMPPDHDEETAYFLIPVDAPHGLLLGCSHLACGGRSKRFRYCAICQVPVSKRNFSSRHKHDIAMGTVLTEQDRQAIVAGNTSSITSPAAVESNPDVVGSSVPSSSTPPSDGAGAAANNNKNSSSDVMMRQLRLSDNGPLDGNGAGEKVTRVLNRQELQWLDLLHHRPTDFDSNGTEFKKWMAALVSAARDTPATTSNACAHRQGHSSRGTNAGHADYEDGDDGEDDDDDDDDDYGDSDDSGNNKEKAGSRRSARMMDRMHQMRGTEDRRSGTNGPPRERSDREANLHIINGNKSDLSMKLDYDDDSDEDAHVHAHVHGREEEKTERKTDDRNDRNNNGQIHDYDEVAQLAPPRENRRSFLQRHESSQLEEDPLPKRVVRRGKGPDDDESGASCKSQESSSRKARPNQGHESMRSDAMSSIAMSSGRDISVTMEEIYGFDVEEVFD